MAWCQGTNQGETHVEKKSLHFSLLLISIGTGINIQAQPIPAEYLEQMVQQGKNPTREIMRNRSMDVYQKSMTVTAYNNLKGISLPLDTSKEHIAYYLPDLQKYRRQTSMSSTIRRLMR